MGVDFNRISFGISSGTSRTGFGTIVSFPSGGGNGCPADGTPTGSVVTQTYEAGSSVYITQTGTSHKNQNADFNILNDGDCGTFIDTSSAQNIVFKPYESFITSYWFLWDTGATVNVLGTDYYSQETRSEYLHDGDGSYYEILTEDVRYVEYSFILSEPITVPVPEIGGNSYSTGLVTAYYHDGFGGITTSTTGEHYAAGTLIWQNVTNNFSISLPSGTTTDASFTGDRYEWAGNGTSYYYSAWNTPYGTFIEEYSGENYYHDGNGGYYTVTI